MEKSFFFFLGLSFPVCEMGVLEWMASEGPSSSDSLTPEAGPWALQLPSLGQLTPRLSVLGLIRDADLTFGFALWFLRKAVLRKDGDKGSSAAFHQGRRVEGTRDTKYISPSP